MVACWHMWKWRNKTIFEDDFQRPNDPTYVIIKMVEDIDKCIHHPLNIRHYDTIFIGWKRPREGWIKLNCDEPTRVLWVLLGVVDSFEIQMADGLKDTLAK